MHQKNHELHRVGNKGSSVTASTLYLDHFQLNRAPFDQEPDPHIFFPAAGRIAVLQNLLADIENGQPLVKLTGSEGTGKTLICRLLAQSLSPEKYRLVSLEHPIGSYENLLRTLCLSLGTVEEERDEDETPLDYAALFSGHLRRIESEGRTLVLLVDEAQNLFLATLERLIRLICDAEESRHLRILLVGRPDLGANLDQLAIYCSNVDINAGYTLEALSFEETREYIHFRLRGAGIAGDKYRDIFTDDAIDMIFQAAMGNISLTNAMAEQGLRKACAQGLFQVDDELFQPRQRLEENVSLALFQGYDFLRENKWWLLAGILLVWLVLMLLWPAGERKMEGAGGETSGIALPEQELVIVSPPEVPEIVEPPPAVLEESESVEPQPAKPVQRMRVERVAAEPEGEEPREVLPERKEMKPQPVQPEIKEVKPQAIPPEIKEVKPQAIPPEKKMVVVEADRKKRAVSVEPVPVTKRTVPVDPAPVKKMEHPSRDGNSLFNERVRASSGWLAWASRGGYTIQLMVLASEDAEDNLKKILVDDRYYALKDQLYILRKISPQAIFVFYGNYSNMEKARQARDTMPQFLRELQPYVLSIHDALQKIEG
jgi:type II secretory pathway predicted ATPase ExeA/septal ring-binding cell division protein DamX